MYAYLTPSFLTYASLAYARHEGKGCLQPRIDARRQADDEAAGFQ